MSVMCISDMVPCHVHQSAKTLKLQMGEVNNNYLVTMAPVKKWDILGSS